MRIFYMDEDIDRIVEYMYKEEYGYILDKPYDQWIAGKIKKDKNPLKSVYLTLEISKKEIPAGTLLYDMRNCSVKIEASPTSWFVTISIFDLRYLAQKENKLGDAVRKDIVPYLCHHYFLDLINKGIIDEYRKYIMHPVYHDPQDLNSFTVLTNLRAMDSFVLQYIYPLTEAWQLFAARLLPVTIRLVVDNPEYIYGIGIEPSTIYDRIDGKTIVTYTKTMEEWGYIIAEYIDIDTRYSKKVVCNLAKFLLQSTCFKYVSGISLDSVMHTLLPKED